MKDLDRAFRYLEKANEDLQEATILMNADKPDGTSNRAYYALFHCILALLNTTDSAISKTHTGSHTAFRKQFILTNIFPVTDSNLITSLFNLRQGGDYELDFDLSIEDAREALDQATDFYQRVRDYLLVNYPDNRL